MQPIDTKVPRRNKPVWWSTSLLPTVACDVCRRLSGDQSFSLQPQRKSFGQPTASVNSSNFYAPFVTKIQVRTMRLNTNQINNGNPAG